MGVETNNPQTLLGRGFTARVPPGFVVLSPTLGRTLVGKFFAALGAPEVLTTFLVIPPGLDSSTHLPAAVYVDELPLYTFSSHVNDLYQEVDNPVQAAVEGRRLGLQSFTPISPARSIELPSGRSHVREYEGSFVNPDGVRVRSVIFLLQGKVTAVKVVVGIQLDRWAEFVGACFEFVGGINVGGGAPLQAAVVALVDGRHEDIVEMNILDLASNVSTPITTLPARIGGATVINIDHSIHIEGSIQGSGIAVGKNIRVVRGKATLKH